MPDSAHGPGCREAAIRYARLGFRVVPIDPYAPRWGRRATTDPEAARALFEECPASGVGLVAGPAGGWRLVALDVDKRRAFRNLLRRCRMPRRGSFDRVIRAAFPGVPISRTGGPRGGGYHVFVWVRESWFRGSGLDRDRSCWVPDGPLTGLEVMLRGRALAVEPSVHRTTRREYVWLRPPDAGRAEAPAWFLEFLAWSLPRASRQVRRPRARRLSGGDMSPRGLLDRVIERFPVELGTRNDQMCRATTYLLGAGADEGTAESVLLGWWEHFDALGQIATPKSVAARKVRETVRSAARKFARGRLRPMETGRGHDDARLSREPSTTERGRLDALHRRGQRRRRTVSNTGLKLVGGLPGDLVVTDLERAYVEALLAHVGHERATGAGGADGTVAMTDDQVAAVMEARTGRPVHPQTMQHLKGKYIDRPGRPATVAALLVEVEKGRRDPLRPVPGTPSRYRLAGLAALLDPIEVAGGRPAPAAMPRPAVT